MRPPSLLTPTANSGISQNHLRFVSLGRPTELTEPIIFMATVYYREKIHSKSAESRRLPNVKIPCLQNSSLSQHQSPGELVNSIDIRARPN